MWFWVGNVSPGTTFEGSYSLWLVALSFLFAFFGAYAALITAPLIAAANKLSIKVLWTFTGSVAFGTGIWSMHFIGMKAFTLPFPVHYNITLTAISIVPAIASGAVALLLFSKSSATFREFAGGSVVLGVGIGSMHYIGMSSMTADVSMAYDPALFMMSVVVAVVLAFLAFYAKFHLKNLSCRFCKKSLLQTLFPAVATALATSGMHYTAMTAAIFYPGDLCSFPGSVIDNNLLVVIANGFIFMLIGLVIVVVQSRKVLERSSLLENIFNKKTDGILVIDENGVIVMFNPGAESILGYSSDDVIGHDITMFMPDAIRKHHNHYLKDNLAPSRENIMGQNREITVITEDGTSIPAEINVSTFTMGEDIMYTATIRDLSARKAAEQALQEAHEKLLKAELEQERQQASRLEAVGQLASGIAHEINTPAQYIRDNLTFLKEGVDDLLGVIKAYQELQAVSPQDAALAEKMKAAALASEECDLDYLKDEMPEAFSQAIDGIGQVARIVSAMKEFSHPSSKEKTQTDINSLITTTTTVSRNEWKYVADLSTDFETDTLSVSCLPGEMNQVLLNLIVNAAHAIGDMVGDDGAAAGAKGNITISTRLDDDWAEIRISDTGSGIPKSVQDKVFTPFFTTKEVGRGSGQGLPICRDIIVNKHAGEMIFESVEGEGTTFIIRIPVEGRNAVKEKQPHE